MGGYFPQTVEAAALFDNEKLKLTATMMAAMHPYAIDYIRQAPAIVLVLHASFMTDGVDKAAIAKDCWEMLARGPKLKDLMAELKLHPQLKLVKARALEPQDYPYLVGMREIHGSTLAQVIPQAWNRQRQWIAACRNWCAVMKRKNQDPWKEYDFAVTALGRYYCEVLVPGAENKGERAAVDLESLCDFAIAKPLKQFLTIEEAHAGMDKWHAELRSKKAHEEASLAYGEGYKRKIDIAPMPEQLTVDGYDFVALQSAHDMFEEGAVMRHCVSTYFPLVRGGEARIYSVRLDKKRVATVEIRLDPHPDMTHEPERDRTKVMMKWRVQQEKAASNQPPEEKIKKAIQKFLKELPGGRAFVFDHVEGAQRDKIERLQETVLELRRNVMRPETADDRLEAFIKRKEKEAGKEMSSKELKLFQKVFHDREEQIARYEEQHRARYGLGPMPGGMAYVDEFNHRMQARGGYLGGGGGGGRLGERVHQPAIPQEIQDRLMHHIARMGEAPPRPQEIRYDIINDIYDVELRSGRHVMISDRELRERYPFEGHRQNQRDQHEHMRRLQEMEMQRAMMMQDPPMLALDYGEEVRAFGGARGVDGRFLANTTSLTAPEPPQPEPVATASNAVAADTDFHGGMLDRIREIMVRHGLLLDNQQGRP